MGDRDPRIAVLGQTTRHTSRVPVSSASGRQGQRCGRCSQHARPTSRSGTSRTRDKVRGWLLVFCCSMPFDMWLFFPGSYSERSLLLCKVLGSSEPCGKEAHPALYLRALLLGKEMADKPQRSLGSRAAGLQRREASEPEGRLPPAEGRGHFPR